MPRPSSPDRSVPVPPGAAGRGGVRERVSAASRQLRRVKRIDRAAVALITLGGVGVIASVVGMLVFIAGEAVPLFREARVTDAGAVSVAAAVASGKAPAALRTLGIDEHLTHVYTVEPDGRLAFWRYADGTLVRTSAFPGLDGATVTSSSRTGWGDVVAAGTSDGRVALAQVRFQPRYAGTTIAGVDVVVRAHGVVPIDEARRPVRDVSYREGDGRATVAAIVDEAAVCVWWRDETGRAASATVGAEAGECFTKVRVGRPTEIAAGTASGRVYGWTIGPDGPRLTSVSPVGDRSVTALAWALGDHTLLVGDAAGRVSGWFDARPSEDAAEVVKVEGHRFTPHQAAITAISPSSRDKSFVTAAADGSLVLHHTTSQRTLVVLPTQGGPLQTAAIAPKADAIVVARGDGRLARFDLVNPHPEVTMGTLFGRTWYEGYPQPAFVWQSTGASDEFEPKLSLVPLVFGTFKATFYALLFAVPLAVLAALYTSQFVHPDLRAWLKPTVEIMAALPSVVVGFVAGLWLAGVVERHLVQVVLFMPLALASGTAGIVLWRRVVPSALRGRVRPGGELPLIVLMILLGLGLAWAIGPLVEQAVFGGDARLWLSDRGSSYAQRNSLVVGLATGFAVIPIVFTIADDAFASVPPSLTAASLALGASRWQTALRVVVPTASPGVFSAVMVGFGRAIGETMIVLMATGNTPLMDWSVFNGMRTLSANIAVEIPEAPVGGTLYRVLFLSAALLFVLTFVANTVAEVIRQRPRDRNNAL